MSEVNTPVLNMITIKDYCKVNTQQQKNNKKLCIWRKHKNKKKNNTQWHERMRMQKWHERMWKDCPIQSKAIGTVMSSLPGQLSSLQRQPFIALKLLHSAINFRIITDILVENNFIFDFHSNHIFLFVIFVFVLWKCYLFQPYLYNGIAFYNVIERKTVRFILFFI